MKFKPEKRVLIIGGGVSGMSAAKVLDSQGINVNLVEKADHLGGNAFDWACMATDKCQYCGACLSQELVDQVEQLSNTTLYKECTIDSIEKKEEGFHVSIKGAAGAELDVDAVILSSGFKPFDPGTLQFFEYNEKGIITTAELNRIFKDESLAQTLNHSESPSIAFIQCVGSRNHEIGNDYCSQICCRTAVRFSNRILDLIPGASVTIFHMDLQTCGKMFRTQVSGLGDSVKLVQGIPGKVLPCEGDKLRLFQEDTETGARKAFDFDIVVLTVGLESVKENTHITGSLGINTDKWGFTGSPPEKTVKNVCTAGTVNGPMDIVSAIEQGISSANEIMTDLDIQPADKNKNVAVLGKGIDGRRVSESLRKAGHSVFLFEEGGYEQPPEGINLFSKRKITDISGTVGNFKIRSESGGITQEVKVSAIVAAIGAGIDSLPDELSSGDNVISLAEFKTQTICDLNTEYNNIVFWLDHAGPEWKSNSREALLSAIELAESGRNVSIIMEKMLVHGIQGQVLYDRARNKGVKFLRVSAPSDVKVSDTNGTFKLEVKEATLAGTLIDVPCELLVIPEPVKAGPENPELADLIHQKTDGEGFLQSPNPRHRRAGSTRKGIFYAGACHDETDDKDLMHEIKAINVFINLISEDETEDTLHAEIDPNKCGKCLTCFRVCPHGAITLDKYEPVISGNACFACGLCVTFCPATAISIKGREMKEIDEGASKETVIFACTRSGALAEKTIRSSGTDPAGYTLIPVDCACSLDSRQVIDQLMNGAEKVMVLSCHSENCRSIHGDTSAGLKISRIWADTGISQSKVSLHRIAANEPGKFRKLIEETTENHKE